MYDGVHPDDYLREKWFRVLCQTIVNDLSNSTDSDFDEQPVHSSSDDDEDETKLQTWEFKRQKTMRVILFSSSSLSDQVTIVAMSIYNCIAI